eukprot:11013091-Ditylum_brightwellii.AAC.1
MKYNEAMNTDHNGWAKAVEEEHDRMAKNSVWMSIKLSAVPNGAKIFTSTWACKLKSNRKKRVCINGHGYEQIDGIHYDGTSIHTPVINKVSVRIMVVLALMADWIGRVNNVKGVFLKGELEEDDKMYMWVPQGLKKLNAKDVVLLFFNAIYGTKQSALAFWRELLKCMKDM